MVSAFTVPAIRNGCVYVAPPDYHLIVDGRHLRHTHGPREQGEPRAGSAHKQAHG